MPQLERDWSKLDELILYVAWRCAEDPRFGKVKLNKILFYSDFLHHARYGSSITQDGYIKQPHGPVPTHVDKRLKKLTPQRAAIIERSFHGFTQKVVVPKEEPRLQIFTGSEIAVVDEVLEALRPENAASVSELSHRFIGWRSARIGENIPITTVLLQKSEPTPEKEADALALAERLKTR